MRLGHHPRAAKNIPLRVGTNDAGVFGFFLCKQAFKPRADPLQVFGALGEDSGVHEHVSQVLQGLALWKASRAA